MVSHGTTESVDPTILRVSYMELREAPTQGAMVHAGPERIVREQLNRETYLDLYTRVGTPLHWDQRLLMPAAELAAMLADGSLEIYVLRNAQGAALGFCEFDKREFPTVELKNFGLLVEAQGRGLGSWLLTVALLELWKSKPSRIWLHTDTWDHPAAVRVYERAGFCIYDVRDEPVGPL